MKRISILDLGTNTFNLLIAEYSGKDEFKILIDNKLPVKLGEGGIQQGVILDQARARAFDVLARHMKTINEYQVSEIFAFGTSALRTARNGPDFAKEILSHFGFTIEIITGEREAELIYKGISLSVNSIISLAWFLILAEAAMNLYSAIPKAFTGKRAIPWDGQDS